MLIYYTIYQNKHKKILHLMKHISLKFTQFINVVFFLLLHIIFHRNFFVILFYSTNPSYYDSNSRRNSKPQRNYHKFTSQAKANGSHACTPSTTIFHAPSACHDLPYIFQRANNGRNTRTHGHL